MKLDTCKCGKSKSYGQYRCDSCHAKYMEKLSGISVASFTKHCKDHDHFYSSDLSCPKCEFADSIEKWAEAVTEIETAAKPTRYNRGSLEVWDAIEKLQLNYMQGNVLKYVSRYKDKKGPEDLLKAINYIVKMIAQETGEDYYELHKLTPEELAKRIKK